MAPLPPMAAVATAVHAIAALQQTRPNFEAFARRRHALIHAHPELHERELSKLAGLVAVTATALRRRKVDDLTATLAAEAGIGAFKVAFDRWIGDPKHGSYDGHLSATLASLAGLFASGGGARGGRAGKQARASSGKLPGRRPR